MIKGKALIKMRLLKWFRGTCALSWTYHDCPNITFTSNQKQTKLYVKVRMVENAWIGFNMYRSTVSMFDKQYGFVVRCNKCGKICGA